MAHWVLYASNESWNFTSKSRDVLYGDQHNIIKNYLKTFHPRFLRKSAEILSTKD